MKFAKLMGRAEDLLPDLQHLCLRYKELKKHLRRIGSGTIEATGSDSSCEAEGAFLAMLQEDVQRLNDYFCEKEEELVILLQHLDEKSAAAATPQEQQVCHVAYIHLHGQIVLLFHWSMLNYTALIKILKKHDKVSGVAMKAPVLANALRQPFSTTGMLSLLLTKCARKAKELGSLSGDLGPLLKKCPQYQALFLIKETQAALDLWIALRENVSTPSTFPDSNLASSNAMKRKHTACSSGGTKCNLPLEGDHAADCDRLRGAEDGSKRSKMNEVAAAAVDAMAAMTTYLQPGSIASEDVSSQEGTATA